MINERCYIGEDPFKVQDRLMDLAITEYEKLFKMISISILQLTFKNYHISSFGAVFFKYLQLSEMALYSLL